MQVNYTGYCSNVGYSIAYQDYISAILKVQPDLDLRLEFVNKQINVGVSPNRLQFLQSLQKKQLQDNRIDIYHTIPPLYKKTSNQSIGFCVYETINPPQKWIDMMNNMDKVFTSTQFNKNVFESNGVKKPIHVIQHCFDSSLFHKDVKHFGRYDLTTFMSIGTWKQRKNWELLIKSWYEAFEKSDNVCLVVKTDKPKELENTVLRIKKTCEWRSKPTAPIFSEEKTLCTYEEIPSIMRKSDIYICASLGEGFGIPLMHAMALHIPVITTRFGGVLEFCHPDNCTYLEPTAYKSIVHMDGIPQLENKIWPVLSIKNTAATIRHALQNKKDLDNKASIAYKYVHNNLTYDVIGKKFIEAVNS